VSRLRLPALYAIVDPLDTNRSPLALAGAYLAGGARLLQLRLKDATPRELYETALALRAVTSATGALLVINDRPDVAAAVGADGVHLGQDDVPVQVARAILGPDRWIGVSTHDEHEARAALHAGADYLGVGPIFTTTSKHAPLPARGYQLLKTVRALTDRPLVAIGGITPATASATREAGADAIAMIAALTRAEDPAATVRDVIARLAAAHAR
jgi:thiamine-phosphate pyrophosphorylase